MDSNQLSVILDIIAESSTTFINYKIDNYNLSDLESKGN